MNRTTLIGLLVVVGAIVAGLEMFVVPKDSGAFLVTITFWTMAAQGCIALVAIAQLAKGIWIIPLRRNLLAAYPALLFLAILYLLTAGKMDIYRWQETPTVWLYNSFFIGRNFVLLLLCFFTARGLSNAIMKGSEKASAWAGWYVTLWVISQSLIAFDWIMSLEYPWISTLFGGFFFIQSFLLGLLVSIWIIFFRTRAGETGLRETLRDCSKMTLAFCFMWGGFFFAQYLVIWYGNIPEEVDYLVKRVSPSPYWGLSRVVLACMFVIPFLTLLPRKVKVIPIYTISIATIIAVGIIVELYVMVAPAVPISPWWLIIELGLLEAGMFVVLLAGHSSMPKEVTPPAGSGKVVDLASAH